MALVEMGRRDWIFHGHPGRLISSAITPATCRPETRCDTNITSVPIDTYQLDLWPAAPAADRVVKQTSEVAAYWHGWAKSLAKAG